jgi:pimeloyl-ACP methyl ester carboxylesterase
MTLVMPIKSRLVLAFVAVWALGMGLGARAGEWLDTPEVQDQLNQIRVNARAAQFKTAVPLQSGQVAVPPVPDSPVDFKFNPDDVKGKDVVVISVCGIRFNELGVRGFELSMLVWYWHRLFPGKEVDAPTLGRMVQALGPDAGDSGASAAKAPLHYPDDYVETTLRQQFSATGKNYLVVPLPWTRNPQKSKAAIADFKVWLAQICDAAQKNGKPVYVVAHSWGSLLVYETLEDLAKSGSPVRVDKFVTLGSPLVPSRWLLKLFVELEEHYQDLEKNVAKPANVKTWINFWAQHDWFSNRIAAADGGDFRVDAAADSLARMIDRVLFSPEAALVKLAVKDLAELNNLDSWHFSYMYGYHQSFPSISRQADIDVLGPDILPEL